MVGRSDREEVTQRKAVPALMGKIKWLEDAKNRQQEKKKESYPFVTMYRCGRCSTSKRLATDLVPEFMMCVRCGTRVRAKITQKES